MRVYNHLTLSEKEYPEEKLKEGKSLRWIAAAPACTQGEKNLFPYAPLPFAILLYDISSMQIFSAAKNSRYIGIIQMPSFS